MAISLERTTGTIKNGVNITRNNKFIQMSKDMVLAFISPIAALSIAFLILGIYPFGNRNIINSDLYTQFLPIMIEFKRAIRNGGSIFYSFNGGLGTNFFTINTYQNASPLTWIFLAIFPESRMVLCATLLFMTKVGLASASMYYYLKSLYTIENESSQGGPHDTLTTLGKDRSLFPLIGLSSIYSLCGYVIAYYYNLMWLECVILLPLIVLGMRRVMDRKGYKLYVISLALMLFSSYYIGLMVYFFLYVYFFVAYFSENHTAINDNTNGITEATESFSEKGIAFIKTFIRVRLLSLVAICLAMVVLLPTYYALLKTGNYEAMGDNNTSLLYYNIPVHLTQLLPGAKVTILSGPANIYSGLITILLCLMYIMNRGIDIRRKVIKSAFAIFVLFCTNFAPIDIAWQLGHSPNGFPNRYSFVFTFLVIELAAESLRNAGNLSKRGIACSFIGIACIYTVTLLFGDSSDIDKRFVLMLGAALIVLYLFAFSQGNAKDNKMRNIFIGTVMLFELVTNTTYGIGAAGVVESNMLFQYKDEVSELVSTALLDDPYARLEIIGTDNYNAPYLYGYKGTSIFASSVPGDTYRMLNTLWDDPNGNGRSFMYKKMNPVADSIANIDYYISFDNELDITWADEVARTENCYLYKSRFGTSIGYMLPSEAGEIISGNSRVEYLNGFIKAALGAEGKVHMDDDGDVDIDEWKEIYHSTFDELLDVSEMSGNRLIGTITAKEGGIFMTSIPYDDGWRIRVDGETVEEFDSVQYLVSFPLEAGVHHIEMIYYPPKFTIGLIISISSLFVFLCAIIISSRKFGGKSDD